VDYKIGDILQFREEGVRHWAGGDKKAMERCRKGRWEYLGLDPTDDRWGEKCLAVRRIDKKDGYVRNEHWSRRFMERAISAQQSRERDTGKGGSAPSMRGY